AIRTFDQRVAMTQRFPAGPISNPRENSRPDNQETRNLELLRKFLLNSPSQFPFAGLPWPRKPPASFHLTHIGLCPEDRSATGSQLVHAEPFTLLLRPLGVLELP